MPPCWVTLCDPQVKNTWDPNSVGDKIPCKRPAPRCPPLRSKWSRCRPQSAPLAPSSCDVTDPCRDPWRARLQPGSRPMRLPRECELHVLDHMRPTCNACADCQCQWRDSMREPCRSRPRTRIRRACPNFGPGIYSGKHRPRPPPRESFKEWRARSLSCSPQRPTHQPRSASCDQYRDASECGWEDTWQDFRPPWTPIGKPTPLHESYNHMIERERSRRYGPRDASCGHSRSRSPGNSRSRSPGHQGFYDPRATQFDYGLLKDWRDKGWARLNQPERMPQKVVYASRKSPPCSPRHNDYESAQPYTPGKSNYPTQLFSPTKNISPLKSSYPSCKESPNRTAKNKRGFLGEMSDFLRGKDPRDTSCNKQDQDPCDGADSAEYYTHKYKSTLPKFENKVQNLTPCFSGDLDSRINRIIGKRGWSPPRTGSNMNDIVGRYMAGSFEDSRTSHFFDKYNTHTDQKYPGICNIGNTFKTNGKSDVGAGLETHGKSNNGTTTIKLCSEEDLTTCTSCVNLRKQNACSDWVRSENLQGKGECSSSSSNSEKVRGKPDCSNDGSSPKENGTKGSKSENSFPINWPLVNVRQLDEFEEESVDFSETSDKDTDGRDACKTPTNLSYQIQDELPQYSHQQCEKNTSNSWRRTESSSSISEREPRWHSRARQNEMRSSLTETERQPRCTLVKRNSPNVSSVSKPCQFWVSLDSRLNANNHTSKSSEKDMIEGLRGSSPKRQSPKIVYVRKSNQDLVKRTKKTRSSSTERQQSGSKSPKRRVTKKTSSSGEEKKSQIKSPYSQKGQKNIDKRSQKSTSSPNTSQDKQCSSGTCHLTPGKEQSSSATQSVSPKSKSKQHHLETETYPLPSKSNSKQQQSSRTHPRTPKSQRKHQQSTETRPTTPMANILNETHEEQNEHRAVKERIKDISRQAENQREITNDMKEDLTDIERSMNRVKQLQARFLQRTDQAVDMAKRYSLDSQDSGRLPLRMRSPGAGGVLETATSASRENGSYNDKPPSTKIINQGCSSDNPCDTNDMLSKIPPECRITSPDEYLHRARAKEIRELYEQRHGRCNEANVSECRKYCSHTPDLAFSQNVEPCERAIDTRDNCSQYQSNTCQYLKNTTQRPDKTLPPRNDNTTFTIVDGNSKRKTDRDRYGQLEQEVCEESSGNKGKKHAIKKEKLNHYTSERSHNESIYTQSPSIVDDIRRHEESQTGRHRNKSSDKESGRESKGDRKGDDTKHPQGNRKPNLQLQPNNEKPPSCKIKKADCSSDKPCDTNEIISKIPPECRITASSEYLHRTRSKEVRELYEQHHGKCNEANPCLRTDCRGRQQSCNDLSLESDYEGTECPYKTRLLSEMSDCAPKHKGIISYSRHYGPSDPYCSYEQSDPYCSYPQDYEQSDPYCSYSQERLQKRSSSCYKRSEQTSTCSKRFERSECMDVAPTHNQYSSRMTPAPECRPYAQSPSTQYQPFDRSPPNRCPPYNRSPPDRSCLLHMGDMCTSDMTYGKAGSLCKTPNDLCYDKNRCSDHYDCASHQCFDMPETDVYYFYPNKCGNNNPSCEPHTPPALNDSSNNKQRLGCTDKDLHRTRSKDLREGGRRPNYSENARRSCGCPDDRETGLCDDTSFDKGYLLIPKTKERPSCLYRRLNCQKLF